MSRVFSRKYLELGQSLGLTAIAFLALLAFVGLVTDVGLLYLSYGQLKRAVDAAAIAAAGEFKRGVGISKLTASANELLLLHNLDPTTMNMQVFICDGMVGADTNGDGDPDPDGERDPLDPDQAPPWTGLPTAFYNICPDTDGPDNIPNNGDDLAPLKLVWVEATQNSPVYFLHLFGVRSVPLHTNSIAEAATIDMLLVFDTSESMGTTDCDGPDNIPGNGDDVTPCTPSYDQLSAGDFDPTTCNGANNCYPLRQAKDAADALVNTLYEHYDRVGIVTFDYYARQETPLTDDFTAVKSAVNGIQLHDDAPFNRLWWPVFGKFNPINPEDRDGDGVDKDDDTAGDPDLCIESTMDLDGNKWRDDRGNNANDDTNGDGKGDGIPCDKDNQLDAFDWNKDGTPDSGPGGPDETGIKAYLSYWHHPASPISTCTGCGLNLANTMLATQGRPSGVWIVIFLSDGVANMSDLPASSNCDGTGASWLIIKGKTCVDVPGLTTIIPPQYPSGMCDGRINKPFWTTGCVDRDQLWTAFGDPPPAPNAAYDTDTPRYCIDDYSPGPNTCPPGSVLQGWSYWPPLYESLSPKYSVSDYARDMADQLALTVTNCGAPLCNSNEPRGNDVVVYSIALLKPSGFPSVEDANVRAGKLLQYIAAVGDDGDRTTDPCSGNLPPYYSTNCGNYYYAASGAALTPIFESIASRIFTRISQ